MIRIKYQKFREKISRMELELGIHLDPVQDYYESRNLSDVAKKYEEPYSNIRRFVNDEIKTRGIEDDFREEFLEVTDFTYLKLEDTFQYDEKLTIWRVLKIVKEGSDSLWLLVPTKLKSKLRHWICDELQPESVVLI